MGQNKSSISIQIPGCLTFSSPIIPCQHLGLFKVKVREENSNSCPGSANAKLLTFLNSFCFCSRNDSQIEIHMAFQSPRSYYEYVGSVLVLSFAILRGSSSASRCLKAWWVTEKDKARLFTDMQKKRTRDSGHRCSKGNSG